MYQKYDLYYRIHIKLKFFMYSWNFIYKKFIGFTGLGKINFQILKIQD